MPPELLPTPQPALVIARIAGERLDPGLTCRQSLFPPTVRTEHPGFPRTRRLLAVVLTAVLILAIERVELAWISGSSARRSRGGFSGSGRSADGSTMSRSSSTMTTSGSPAGGGPHTIMLRVDRQPRIRPEIAYHIDLIIRSMRIVAVPGQPSGAPLLDGVPDHRTVEALHPAPVRFAWRTHVGNARPPGSIIRWATWSTVQ